MQNMRDNNCTHYFSYHFTLIDEGSTLCIYMELQKSSNNSKKILTLTFAEIVGIDQLEVRKLIPATHRTASD